METNSLPEAPINDAGGSTGNMSEKDFNDTLSILKDENPSQTDDSVTPADDQPSDDIVTDDVTTDDSTSADDDTDDSNGEDTQPTENNDEVLDDDTASPAPDTDSKFDKDLDDWATKRGYKLTDDSVRRIAQDARNAQRELRATQEANAVAAKLNSVLGDEPATPPAQNNTEADEHPEDPYYFDPDAELRKEFKEFQNWTKQQLETSTGLRLQSEFVSTNNVTEAESEAMVSLVKSEKEAGNLEAVRFLSDPKNLQTLYKLAKLEMAENANNDGVAEKVRAQERERLAKISQAGGPNRSSKSTVTNDKKVDDIMIGLLADD